MWASKMTPDTYPVLFAIFAGVSLAGWFSVRGLMYNPDVKINKVQRSQTIRSNETEGKAWVQHHKSIRGDGYHAATTSNKQE
ncbi:hypothetical protein BASA81_001433 [Batrachochytrium salamandrivorans]|nr:hypothetical protein BASA81_001433 [Batrachochytrium salamandrivorans]